MMGIKGLRRRALTLAWATTLLSLRAAAADFELSVTCSSWTAESTAQVEARIQASLLLDRRGARQVIVACPDGVASVEVMTDAGRLFRPVTYQGRSLEDDVVESVERALQELQAPSPPPATTSQPAAPNPAVAPPPPPPRTAPTASAAPPQPAAQPAAPVRDRSVELRAKALAERWSERWAWGAEAGLSVGDSQLQYGLTVAGRVATDEPSSFEVNEWSSAAHVQLTSRALLGLRGGVGLGASLFVTTPASEVTVQSETLLGTAFAELTLSRPFWLGRFGLSPQVGARFFSGSRRVRVNDAEMLVLPLVATQASLSLLWALPLGG